ncbi:hypothetical protein GYB62_00415 [bacterium]|nr:hypothetical protein [bacterium]
MLPEIQFAYDLAFQQQFADPLAELIDHINIAEGFFEADLGMRFSIVSIHELSASQDAVFDGHGSVADLLEYIVLRRLGGSLSYAPSTAGLFHLVSGRDFSAGGGDPLLLGVGYIGTACRRDGYASSVSLSSDAPLLGRVIAHEVGHNLGAVHDEDTVCLDGRHLMSATITAGLSGFSACSRTDINSYLNGRVSSSCFDFPADVGIQVAQNGSVVGINRIDDSAADVVVNDADWQQGVLDINYRVSSQRAFRAFREFSLDASVVGAEVVSASFAQQPCTIVAADRYECRDVSFGFATYEAVLSTRLQAQVDSITIDTHLDADAVDTVDVDASNDNLTISVISGDYIGLSRSLGSQGVELSWFTHLVDPDGARALGASSYRIEYRSLADSASTFSFLARLSPSEFSFVHDFSDVPSSTEYRVALESSGADDLYSLSVIYEKPAVVSAGPVVGAVPSSNSGGGAISPLMLLLTVALCCVHHRHRLPGSLAGRSRIAAKLARRVKFEK